MTTISRHVLVILMLFYGVGCVSTAVGLATVHEADVVVYGGTPAGIMAAVQAKRMGRSAVIVCPDQHLGGLSSGGLGWTDAGKKEVVGGLSREFYERVGKWYGKAQAQWTFEPHVAEKIFEELVRENQIPVYRARWLNREPGRGVAATGGRIESVTMTSGETYRGKIFIDATYEGDLMAAAGVGYTVGREPNSRYQETLNGVQVQHARAHQFTPKISAYRVPGDRTSGLLPRVSSTPPGRDGEGDRLVAADISV